MQVNFKLNGTPVVVDVEPRMHLADCLRDELRQTGTHLGCEHGVCASSASGKRCATNRSRPGVSVNVPLSVTSAGTRPFGFTARYSGLRWACEPKSSRTASYGAPASSSAMWVASA